MALSLALHGLAAIPLLLAGLSGGSASDEPALLVELMLAAPAPAAQDDVATPATTPAESSPVKTTVDTATETAIELPLPEPPPPPDTAQFKPADPKPIEPRHQPPPEPEIKVELPPPDEPPPLDTARLKPVDPPKPAAPPPKPQAKAPANPQPKPARQAAPVTQSVAAPNTGDAQATQTLAGAQQPLIVFEGKPRFRLPPKPPVYPPRAIELGHQGEALVRVRLEPDGSAAEIVLWRGSGFALLDRAALHAVRGWHFLPAMRGGRAVAAWVEIPVRFHLR